MSGFTVPFSSSPPSTPDTQRSKPNRRGHSSGNFDTHPSTTPAGPPPSSARSFTPAGPPPSSVFGSSQLGSGNTLFASNKVSGPGKPLLVHGGEVLFKPNHSRKDFDKASDYPNNGLNRQLRPKLTSENGSRKSSLSTDKGQLIDFGETTYNDNSPVNDEVEEQSEEGSMDVDSDAEDHSFEGDGTTNSQLDDLRSSTGYNWALHGSSIAGSKSRGTKRSRAAASTSDIPLPKHEMQMAKRKDSAIPAIAKNLAKQLGTAPLDEPDQLIIKQEEVIRQLQLDETSEEERERLLEVVLVVVPEALCKLWQSCSNEAKHSPNLDQAFKVGIGPREDEGPFIKANFLAQLLLRLHHPPTAKGKRAPVLFRTKRPSQSMTSFRVLDTFSRSETYPKILIDWLEQYHNPYAGALSDLRLHIPNPTAHSNFWDIIFSTTLRGKLTDVLRVFKDSNFRYARTAQDDGDGDSGYRGTQLESITEVINRTIKLLEDCPAIQDEDWNITGNDWMIFRKHVEQEMSYLSTYAEGRDRSFDRTESAFEAKNFGMRSASNVLSQSARRAQSKVPWSIYQNLKTFYGILLGGATEIVSFAQDWVESTISLAIWWNGGDDDDIASSELAVSKNNLGRSRSRAPRTVDVNASAAYQRRLAYAFQTVTNESDEGSFQINSMNPVEVGLASVFEGNLDGVLRLLFAWSIPVTAAIIEVASAGGWFDFVPGESVTTGFNESDLMVLSYGQPERGLSKDGILIEYSDLLCEREELIITEPRSVKEGWELAVQVLGRLDDPGLASRSVNDIVGGLTLDSDERTDKLISVCRTFGLEKEACEISQRYASYIAENFEKYGTALIYFARAHNHKKVKNVLDLLISLSLVQSIAYPPLSSIDAHLRDFILHPRQSLSAIASTDPDAAEILQIYFSGYATLRKFYDLRDEEVNLSNDQRPSLRPVACKKAAAVALLTVIESAADNIQGGLYDLKHSAIIQVDGLMTLLGEAMILVDQPTRILSIPQLISLLRAIEDLQTVHPRIYNQCQECFQSTLAAAHGSLRAPSPRTLMKKSVSELTASSGFSLVGSEMLEEGSMESERGSGVLVKGKNRGVGESSDLEEAKRGWDWRIGIRKGAKGDEVLGALRLGVAREMARAWIEGDG